MPTQCTVLNSRILNSVKLSVFLKFKFQGSYQYGRIANNLHAQYEVERYYLNTNKIISYICDSFCENLPFRGLGLVKDFTGNFFSRINLALIWRV